MPQHPVGQSESPVALIEAQRRTLTQILQATIQRRELIDDPQEKRLVALMLHRQKLIEQLTDLDRRLKDVRRDPAGFAASLEGAQAAYVRAVLDEIASMRSRILEMDEQDRQRLTERRDAAAAGLGRARKGSTAQGAYRANVRAGYGQGYGSGGASSGRLSTDHQA